MLNIQTKRKTRSKSRKTPIPISLGVGFPTQLSMTHKYVDEFTLAGALGVMANYRFRANGLFDPNHTATGHQPAYYDVLSGVYNQWIVTNSIIELMIIPTSAGITPVAIGLALNDDVSTLPTTFTAYEEASLCKVNYLVPDAAVPLRLTLTYSPTRLYPTMDGNLVGGLWGGVTTDPAIEQIYNVFLQSVDQVTSASAFVVAKVTYTATWFKLKDLVTS